MAKVDLVPQVHKLRTQFSQPAPYFSESALLAKTLALLTQEVASADEAKEFTLTHRHTHGK